MPSWWSNIAHNVKNTYLFTLFLWAARSILFQQILSGYVYVLTESNKPVGIVKGIQGMSQLVFTLPSGYLADRIRRDTILQVSAVIGLLTAGLTFYAVEANYMNLLYVAFALWGLFSAFQNPAMEALFADSIEHGKRSYPFMIKYNISNLAMILGPFLSILLFLYYGDEWELRMLQPVLEFGCLMAIIASLLLFRYDDDLALENQLIAQQEDGARSSRHSEDPLKTPTLKGDGMEIEYDYSDSEGEQEKKVSEATSLLVNVADPALDERVKDDGPEPASIGCFSVKHVPLLLFISDFIISNGAGMTINFFPLFFLEEYGLSPIHMSILFTCQPIVVMGLSFAAQHLSRTFGRMPMIVSTRWMSLVCLFCMTYARPLGLQIALFLMRGGTMRCSQPLRRSILMDFVPKDVRARWNSLEGLSVFSWSGSAVLGGYIIDAYGYRMCFFITSFVYFVGLVVELLLLPLTKHAVEK